MCTRFVYNGIDTITGFNFDTDPAVWTHTAIKGKDRFYIGIKMLDGNYYPFHGANKSGNMGTLLYVNDNENGKHMGGRTCCTISKLTENFIRGEISLDDAFNIVQNSKVIYAPDTTMQAMLSDRSGCVPIIEPGLGYRLEQTRYSLIINYSVLRPETIRPYVVPGDDRFERGVKRLEVCGDEFSVVEAFRVLKSVKQGGLRATRVSLVYSAGGNKVYYVLNNDFEHIGEYGS